MSQFDFPRIHFNGLIDVNVGTANNDDYALGYTFCDESFNPPKPEWTGKPLRLADSVQVQPDTLGMTDEEWLAWAQNIQKFHDSNGNEAQLIPAEWNYYGGMGLTMKGVEVQSVQTSPNDFDTTSNVLGAELSFNMRPGGNMASTGVICDVNPESVPSSQFIASNVLLEKNDEALMSGTPSKGSTRYINFQRNVALTASAGASTVVFHTIPKEELADQEILKVLGMAVTGRADFKGVMIRYSLYRSIPPINGFDYSTDVLDQLVKLYQDGGLNAAELQITGTISPWYEGEFSSITMCRQMMPEQSFPSPGGNGSSFVLAPILMEYRGSENPFMSLDLINTFPEQYNSTNKTNPKYSLGTVSLRIVSKQGSDYVPFLDLGPIDYSTENYMKRGGLIDVDLTAVADQMVDKTTENSSGSGFPVILELYAELYQPDANRVLSREVDYMIASDTSTVYAEQEADGTVQNRFNFNGVDVACSFAVYYRGSQVQSVPGGLTIQVFDTTPNQTAHGPVSSFAYTPGDPLSVALPTPGNRLFYCALPGQTVTSYNDVNLMTFPMITMRVLPTEDYDQYYVYPSAEQPVANNSLTFDILYQKVLQNYYLLYPAMSKHVPLNNEAYWNGPDMARRMYQRIQRSMWPETQYMPRTRDLSESRRKLLQAWCLRVMQG